jgi:hypothetical protein
MYLNRKIAFTNARIITMKGDEVIEKGTIIIDHNKIVNIAVGNRIGETQYLPMPSVIDINRQNHDAGYCRCACAFAHLALMVFRHSRTGAITPTCLTV